MKINKIAIEGFRGYKDKTEIQFNSFNVIIGRNDIGKSTILEALDIFFNDGDAINKFSKEDISVGFGKKDTKISVEFSNFPEELVLDSTVPTNLKEEYLLNKDQRLEILKTYKSTGLTQIELIANSPTNKALKDLWDLKIDALRTRAEELNVPVENYNGAVSSSIRKAIREQLNSKLEIRETSIVIWKKTDNSSPSKEIWVQLQNHLPIYSLFQADRKNEEKDSEVQNPINTIIKHVVKDAELQDAFNKIQTAVQTATEGVANKTIEKLKEMNAEIADSLTASFSDPKWESVFKFNLYSDDNIPLNKRGSGVRRLILLNFFRAEAERLRNTKNVPGIIYALEEPETSQHPHHQLLLLDAFRSISEDSKNQVILTTHSPNIARQIGIQDLIFIDKSDGKPSLPTVDESIYKLIADELGVLPNFELGDATKVKLALCFEGKNDIVFFKAINQNIEEFRAIIDLSSSDHVIFLPMGGSSLQFWVNNDYLSKLNLKQFHLYDSDIGSEQPNKYQKFVEIINAKGNGNFAVETSLREMENLYSPSLIRTIYGIPEDVIAQVDDWATIDLPYIIAKHNHENSESEKLWDNLEKEDIKKKTSNIKNQLNNTHAHHITKESLIEIGAYDEVKSWFEKVKELLND